MTENQPEPETTDDDRYEIVADCIEGRCIHTTAEQCVASWRVLLGTGPEPEPVREEGVPSPEAIARARSQALIDFLADNRLPSEWVVGTTEDGETITINDALRLAANREREVAP